MYIKNLHPGDQERQVDGEGRAGCSADQDPGAAAAGLGLLHPQEPGHDAGLRRGRALQGVRVRPGLRGTLQSQESSQPQVGILQFTKPLTMSCFRILDFKPSCVRADSKVNKFYKTINFSKPSFQQRIDEMV